jgi:hypothetical protein
MLGCPACGSSRLKVVFDWPDVPANSALFLETREEAVGHPRGSIRLTVCRDCGFVFNRAFDPSLPEYSERGWIDEYGLQGAHVLEVGAGGNGEFLHLFCELSGGTGVGLDPAVSREQQGDIQLLSRPFDATWAEPADAVICRHTLEHIGSVGRFLDQLAAWGRTSERAVYLFELPDFSTILERRSFWDIYYEHASYFTADTLQATFARHGFEPVRCRRAFDDQYLILEARLGDVTVPAVDPEAILRATELLAVEYGERAPIYARRFRELRSEGPVLIWQAGSKAAALAGIPGVEGCVDALVDIHPGKTGRFMVGSGLPIVSPDRLPALEPAHIVVMNAIYLDEIAGTCRGLGVEAAIHSADTLILRRAGEHERTAV